jgi:DNA-binding transcriptional ArsR family regulator
MNEDAVFNALADATRRRLLDRLIQVQGQTLNELVANLDMRRQSATRHLKVLEEAGLIVVHWHGREKRHYLNPMPIVEIQRRWIDKFSSAKVMALLELKLDLEEGN